MCGRYYIPEEDAAEELERILAVLDRRGQSSARGDIGPTQSAAVVANSRSGRPTPFLMRWGYRMQGRPLLINARSETAAERAVFRDGMQCRRCLIPAASYYEWDPAKRCHRFSRRDEPLLWMAGVYRHEPEGACFVILTREAVDEAARVHTRMPVLLSEESRLSWLEPRYRADEVLRDVLTDVTSVPLPRSGPDQLSIYDLL